VLADALVLQPDVAMCQHVREELSQAHHQANCLKRLGSGTPMLLALNFKNPPGRLLRRQWTQPLVGVPDYHHWRLFKD
jgi:hypothetical protein